MVNNDTVLELKGITKRFSGFVANDSIDFDLKKGEIHALLGGKWRWKINIDEYCLWLISTRRRRNLYQ